MPTNQFHLAAATTVHIATVNPNRVALTIKNMSGIDGQTGTLCRISNSRNVGKNEGYIMEDSEIIHMIKLDGDRPDKDWYARMVTGGGTLCIIEEFGDPRKRVW